ncbi:outer membrane protein OmpA-like peptidoglycan-associated protein [Nocardiopsis arvandica]|uniref:Outer membrane protein OmpA-like peptidoglycan-associated protein n=1 Tax=Nocardiopsis sinuspersici TaxID=501010 RepID=A0A7Z0BLA7_9ACTN|nr:outer membrane protein OmpA-like peptidoglycan-associated protein [Nocardiopsis sinuspersici]
MVNPNNPSQGSEEVNPSAPDSLSPSPGENESHGAIASSTASATSIAQNFQIDVYALENVGEGRIRLRLGVTNNSGASFHLYSGLGVPENPRIASGITLLDPNNRKRYLNYEQSNGSCFCSPTSGNIASGETLEMWIIYPSPPDDVESMTITNPLTPPLLDVPISQSSETVENTGLAEPRIIDLVTITDDLEDQTGRTESGDEVSIILSSDVLFETNSAELSPDAQEILEQVAIEVDDASSTVVNIDGHADNTGSESVNLPLSEDRAKSVETVLSELVDREDVTFEVKGYGSKDPIASNDTEEGRERNRRVSITFEK